MSQYGGGDFNSLLSYVRQSTYTCTCSYMLMFCVPVPTLEDLMTEVAAAIPHKWREVAVGLGLRAADIQRINAENPQQNCTQCYIAVFDTWERTETKPYIWKTIIDCLHSSLINERKLANEISDRLVKK